jgi:transposase
MGLLNIIRRMSLREKLSIREISRRTGLSRNTITKHLNAGTIEPQFTTPDRRSKLDPFADKLTSWLKAEAGKSRKQRRTLKQLHADLMVLGFSGSYNRVAAFARDWRFDRQRESQTTGRGTFIPLTFRPGEAFQFDWSEDFAVLAGERTKLQVAHIKLSHSRAFVIRAYLLQTHEKLFDAHWHGFRVFGGVPERGIYDNMRTAVDRIGRGKERQINMRFLAMTNHYVFGPEFCNPAAGWEKGQVEKNVRDARHRFWQPMPEFPDLAALNDWLELRCMEMWREIPHGGLLGSIADVWIQEQAALMPLPCAFDGFVEHSKRVSPIRIRIRMCMLTGARVGEVRTARSEQFNIYYVAWSKPAATTKQRKIHRVPISQEVVTIVRQRQLVVPRGNLWLFPSKTIGQPVREIRRFWMKVQKDSDLPDLHIHDPRHTFASLLVSGGASLEMIGKLLGHSHMQTTQRLPT